MSTTYYVDSNFAAQGARKVWASGSPNAVDPGANYAEDLATVFQMIEDGDSIKVARGTYALPAGIDYNCKIMSLPGTPSTFFNYTPVNPIGPYDNYCQINAGKTVHFIRGKINGPLAVLGNLVLDNVEQTVPGIQVAGSALVMIGTMTNTITRNANCAFERYDAYYSEGRWQSKFPKADYRNPAVLMAPAKLRSPSGAQKVTYVPIAEFRYAQKDLSGTETGDKSVNFAVADMFLFTRPGLVAHPDMQIVTKGKILQIKQVFPPDAPGEDLKILATIYTGA